MSKHFGAPGLGGSLGKCAICGENFLTLILDRKSCDVLKLKGIPQTLYVHPECGANINDYLGDNWRKLPDLSPIKIAFLKHEAERERRAESRAS